MPKTSPEPAVSMKPITFYPTFEQAVFIEDCKARMNALGRTGHRATNKIIIGAAINELADKENLLEILCSEGAPA